MGNKSWQNFILHYSCSGSRRPPSFAHTLWNCHDAVFNNIGKTNNNVEGWNRSFSSMLGSHHPNLWKLIEGLTKEQILNELKIEQILSKHPPPPSRKVYKDLALRLHNIVKDYDDYEPLDFLRAVAHNIDFNV